MFDNRERFIIEDYNKQTTFASFLPGISGIYGTPIWSFYVNRGQAITSFGAENKDHSIMEFYPAHQAYQITKTMGFRTFIKVDGVFYEPFHSDEAKTKMYIGMNELELEETIEELGIQINVLYYTLPNERLGGLVRTVTVKNLTEGIKDIEVLDGMPAIIPYGLCQKDIKEMAQTMKAWMQVEDVETGLPYYRVRFSTVDSTEVLRIDGGNYMVTVDGDGKRLPIIGDPELVFEYDTSFEKPVGFINKGVDILSGERQMTANQMPSGFACLHESLAANGSVTFYTVIGQAENKDIFHSFAESGLCKSFFDKKYDYNIKIINEIGSNIYTKTANPVFDAYCKQTYVDNVLRGGYPIKLGDKDDKVFYVYSRKHGDIERDYNFFSMLPEYFSQGNGNFRDINQNRRCDVFFSPFVKEHNIKVFYNLLQLDGYNPLFVKQVTYIMEDADTVLQFVDASDRDRAAAFFKKEFSPGRLFTFLNNEKIKLVCDEKKFLDIVMDNSAEKLNADFGEGYWTDHWTYNLDLIDSYLAVYPEKEEELLFDDKSYTYFESQAVVLPRAGRYVKTANGVRQFKAVDEELKAGVKHDKARTNYGKGEVYSTNLMTKLMLMAATKFAALDMQGMGIDMEGGKPGWYDALNGLPSLLGSSMCETYELQRQLMFIKAELSKYRRDIAVPCELYDFIAELRSVIDEYNREKHDRLWVWNHMNICKEEYRNRIIYGVEGTEKALTAADTVAILDKWIAYVDEGIRAACDRSGGIAPAYFAYSFSDYTEHDGVITPVDFKVEDMPLFLEGPVRYLKLPITDVDRRDLYSKVKASGMYDKKLSMYKVNESLDKAPFEVGRARAFSPGWLENESIWLHMEYKYLLELIKSGMYSEYFEDLQKAGVPFLSYEEYGRSPLENSSFIVSSANFNDKIHGKGFVARLSGSTAEFLEMWEIMMFGSDLFTFEDGELCCTFKPAIPEYLIPEDGRVECNLFGRTKVVYNFGSSRDIIPGGYSISKMILKYAGGGTEEVAGFELKGDLAESLRAGEVEEIQVTF